MSAPRDLADAQQRIEQLQSYIDQFAEALARRDAALERIRKVAQSNRDTATKWRELGHLDVATEFDNTADELDRILEGKS